MEFEICLDYLKFCNLSYREKESVLDWYAKSIGFDFVDLNILNFFNSNLKRKLVAGDIHVFLSKNKTYNIVVAGMSCRGLLENLNTLLKEINPECLRRIDVKIIEDCNMSVDEIIVQHQFLTLDKSSNWIKVDSRLGVTSYTAFSGGKVRVYNYYDLSETSLELQFDKKECLIKIRDYLINDKIEDLKLFLEENMVKELLKLPREFELLSEKDDLEKKYEKFKEIEDQKPLHLDVNLFCGKMNESSLSEEEKKNLPRVVSFREGEIKIDKIFAKDACLVFYFLYCLYKIEKKKRLAFNIKDYFFLYGIEDTKRSREKFKESLFKLFELGFVLSGVKNNHLTRFISDIFIKRNGNLEVVLNPQVFNENEIINTPFNVEDFKEYLVEIKEEKPLKLACFE